MAVPDCPHGVDNTPTDDQVKDGMCKIDNEFCHFRMCPLDEWVSIQKELNKEKKYDEKW